MVVLCILSLALSAATTSAQVSLEFTQRFTECLDTSLGGYDHGEFFETGPWVSDVSVTQIATGYAHQNSAIQAAGNTLVVEGDLSALVELVGQGTGPFIETSSYLAVHFTVTEPSFYSLRGSLAGGATLYLRRSGSFLDIVTPGPFDLAGSIEPGVYYVLEVYAALGVALEEEGSVSESAGFTLTVTDDPAIPDLKTSWGNVKGLFR